MEKIKLTPSQFAVFRTGNKVTTSDNDTYYNYPFWIKPVKGKPDEYEIYMPAEINKIIHND